MITLQGQSWNIYSNSRKWSCSVCGETIVPKTTLDDTEDSIIEEKNFHLKYDL